jgi:hypothetical protein
MDIQCLIENNIANKTIVSDSISTTNTFSYKFVHLMRVVNGRVAELMENIGKLDIF